MPKPEMPKSEMPKPEMPNYDVIGIGNAIVDVIARTDDHFLENIGLVKGSMKLIDDAQAEAIYARMSAAVECSGGSAANTIAGIASLGGNAAYIGRTRNDQLGDVFAHDIRSLGVAFRTLPATEGAPTARCLVLVTPDAQRTMCTYLGACVDLGPEDVDAELIQSAKVLYLEGYLWDPARAKEAFLAAMNIAHDAGAKVALSLSDAFCVDRYRAEFLDLAENYVDILFANEQEICSLYQTSNFDDALQQVRGHCEVAALTRSAKGSVIVSGSEFHIIDAEPVDQVVDTTGAGDLYAAGFLYGYTKGYDLASCGRLGAIAAAEVISHIGARPNVSLADLVRTKMSL
jgi:sugar/nucleoside kinase (ribokinase family)